MKVFVTGGSGFIGSQVVKQLVAKGNYEVTALARSEESAKKVEALGATAVRGELTDLDLIVENAKQVDAFLHLGFIHDFANIEKSITVDYAVVEAVCEAYVNTNKTFIDTSGTLVYADIDPAKMGPLAKRDANTKLALSYSSKGVRTMDIVLCPSVHGKGEHGFVPLITNIAKANGASYYCGSGDNVWPVVHVTDAASLYLLALEKGESGTSYIGALEHIKTKDLAEAIAKKINVEAVSTSPEQMFEKGGPFFGTILCVNNPVSNEETKSKLGWNPTGPTFFKDYEENYEF